MTNKAAERLATFTLLMPANTALNAGAVVLLGKGSHAIPGVLGESQTANNATGPPSDPNTGYLLVDFEGAFFLSVTASTLASPSAGAQINPGDAVYLAGGTYDVTSGITYGGTLCVDTTGDFVGVALNPVAAGTTATIAVLLRNAC